MRLRLSILSALIVAFVVSPTERVHARDAVAHGHASAPCTSLPVPAHGRGHPCVAPRHPEPPPLSVTSTAPLPLTRVTTESPLAGCTAGSESGTNFPNSAVEPAVAVDPRSPATIVGVWQQDRWSNGGSHGLVAGSSHDGGRTWIESTLPFDVCAPGGLSYERASDPSVSMGPDGTVYAAGLAITLAPGAPNTSAIVAATSSDGGRTWSGPRIVVADNSSPALFNDKDWITADPTKSGVAYVVWDRLDDNTSTGPTLFSRTTDGGRTWSQPQVIFAPDTGRQSIGNQILVDPRTGTLYNLFLELPYSNEGAAAGTLLRVERSTDGGQHWSAPSTITSTHTVGVFGSGGRPLRTGWLPYAAIDQRTGAIYLVWEDDRFSGGRYDEIALTSSADGVHWTAPTRVNTPSNGPAIVPVVAVDGSGEVAVSYYDLRDASPGTELMTDAWLTLSTDGGATFGHETRLASFDTLQAPRTDEGYFLGDYEGMGSTRSGFLPFFSATSSEGHTDVYAEGVRGFSSP